MDENITTLILGTKKDFEIRKKKKRKKKPQDFVEIISKGEKWKINYIF